MRLICLLLLAVVALKSSEASKVSCKDEDDNDVDWWHMYLLQRTSDEEPVQRYLYVTSKDYEEWKLSEYLMGQSNSLPAQTLNPLYGNDDILLAAYNDVFPNGTTFEVGGAAKGVIASDGDTGMWLVHSIPEYPVMFDHSHLISNNSQAHNLLCLTLDGEGVKKVGDLLVLYEPHFYYNRNPLGLYRFPNLQRAMYQIWLTDGVNERDVELRTLDGEKLRFFGRNGKSNKELYADIIGPALDVTLWVRTNRITGEDNNMPNICNNSNKLFNLVDVACPARLIHKIITSGEDHSKWAVSQETGFKLFGWRIGGSDWICIGDLNRWHTHQNRGGGAICHKNSRVAQHYRKMVHSFDNCIE
ncbi:plancitoxin-1 [Drosophila innubila]|uniref:plancitoxin-1 n=1 Tax=Drosophila innubila TaxID=198719 RepID=UPI00148CC045|nr:plancitoxin-1 [Drosophila innubila]